MERTGIPFFSVDSFIHHFEYFTIKIKKTRQPLLEIFFTPCEHSCYQTIENSVPGVCSTCRNRYDFRLARLQEHKILWDICFQCGIYQACTHLYDYDTQTWSLQCNMCSRVKFDSNEFTKQCRICNKVDKNVVFTPCSHIECCQSCAKITQFCGRCFTLIDKKRPTTKNS